MQMQGTNDNSRWPHATGMKSWKIVREEVETGFGLWIWLVEKWYQFSGPITKLSLANHAIPDYLWNTTQHTSYLEKPWLVTRSSCNKRSSWIRLGSWSNCVGGKMLGMNRAKSIGLRSENSAKRIILLLYVTNRRWRNQESATQTWFEWIKSFDNGHQYLWIDTKWLGWNLVNHSYEETDNSEKLQLCHIELPAQRQSVSYSVHQCLRPSVIQWASKSFCRSVSQSSVHQLANQPAN